VVTPREHREIDRGRTGEEFEPPALRVERDARQTGRFQLRAEVRPQPRRVQALRHADHVHRHVGIELAPAQHHRLEQIELPGEAHSRASALRRAAGL
jgi:hypothetical protein